LNLNALLEADARWSGRLNLAERPGPLRTFAGLLAHSGDSWLWGLGLLAVWLLGGPFWKSWSALLVAAILLTAGLVMGVKLVVRRRRPEGDWGSIYRRTDPHSFPSGHAARAALLATLVAGWGPAWLAPITLVWAPLVILARVAMGLHYLSDVLAGAALGWLVGIGFLLALG
jgi:undecaprenyl-diphosphatase